MCLTLRRRRENPPWIIQLWTQTEKIQCFSLTGEVKLSSKGRLVWLNFYKKITETKWPSVHSSFLYKWVILGNSLEILKKWQEGLAVTESVSWTHDVLVSISPTDIKHHVSRQCPSDCITVTVWRRTARHRHGGINDVLWLVFVSGADLVSHLKHVLFLPPALTQGYSTVRILLSGHSVLRKDKQNRTSATDISFLPCGWSW